MDQLLATQEEHAKRYGAILEKWERQTGLKKPWFLTRHSTPLPPVAGRCAIKPRSAG